MSTETVARTFPSPFPGRASLLYSAVSDETADEWTADDEINCCSEMLMIKPIVVTNHIRALRHKFRNWSPPFVDTVSPPGGNSIALLRNNDNVQLDYSKILMRMIQRNLDLSYSIEFYSGEGRLPVRITYYGIPRKAGAGLCL